MASLVLFVAEPAAAADSLRSAALAAEPQAVRPRKVIALATVAALFLTAYGSDGAPSSPQDRRPELVAQEMPGLYEVFAGCKHMGTPVVRMMVLLDGSTARHRVIRTSGCTVADKRVVDAIRAWKYRPAIRKGTPVASPVTVTVSW